MVHRTLRRSNMSDSHFAAQADIAEMTMTKLDPDRCSQVRINEMFEQARIMKKRANAPVHHDLGCLAG